MLEKEEDRYLELLIDITNLLNLHLTITLNLKEGLLI